MTNARLQKSEGAMLEIGEADSMHYTREVT